VSTTFRGGAARQGESERSATSTPNWFVRCTFTRSVAIVDEVVEKTLRSAAELAFDHQVPQLTPFVP